MYLQDDYFVYTHPDADKTIDMVIAGDDAGLSGYSTGELFIHEFGDGTRDLVWIDGSGTARRMPSVYVNSISAPNQDDNTIWRDSSSNALAWKAGGQAYSILGDRNSVGNVGGLQLSSVQQGVKVEFGTDEKRFLPQEFRLFRGKDPNPTNDLGIIGNGHVDSDATDGETYYYKVRETTTLADGSTSTDVTEIKSITYEEPYPGRPATSAPQNVSVGFGNAVSGPYPVIVTWDDTRDGYDVLVQIDQQDSFGAPWNTLFSSIVPESESPGYHSQNDDGKTFTDSELGYRVKVTLYYTHPDGAGPTATVYKSSPSGSGS